jgi:hypothetical protein
MINEIIKSDALIIFTVNTRVIIINNITQHKIYRILFFSKFVL